MADHEKRLPSGGTKARSVAAAFEAYEQAVEVGLIQLAPSTAVTVSAARSSRHGIGGAAWMAGSSARIRLSQLQPGRTSSGSTPQCARRVGGIGVDPAMRDGAQPVPRPCPQSGALHGRATPVPRRRLDPGRTLVTEPVCPGHRRCEEG